MIASYIQGSLISPIAYICLHAQHKFVENDLNMNTNDTYLLVELGSIIEQPLFALHTIWRFEETEV